MRDEKCYKPHKMGDYGHLNIFLPIIYHCRIICTFSLISRGFSTSVGQVWGKINIKLFGKL